MSEVPKTVADYDDPRTFPLLPWELASFREAWRDMGPRHRLVDRWRFTLGWNIEPEAVRDWLQGDRETRH